MSSVSHRGVFAADDPGVQPPGATLRARAVQVVTGTDLVVSGLDGDTDREYYVEGRILVPSATSQTVVMLPNGDTANLTSRMSGDFAASTHSAIGWWIVSLGVGFTGAPLEASFDMRLFAGRTLNGVVVNRTQFGKAVCAGTATNVQAYPFAFVGQWQNTTANLTSLVVRSTASNGILAGSEVRVWAPASSFGA